MVNATSNYSAMVTPNLLVIFCGEDGADRLVYMHEFSIDRAGCGSHYASILDIRGAPGNAEVDAEAERATLDKPLGSGAFARDIAARHRRVTGKHHPPERTSEQLHV